MQVVLRSVQSLQLMATIRSVPMPRCLFPLPKCPLKNKQNPKKNQHPKTIVYIHFSNCSESLVLRTPFDVSYYGEQDRSNHPECTSLVYGQL